MEVVTLALAGIGIYLVMSARPLKAFLVYMALLCWYSAWQPVELIGIHITAPRLVIPILVWRLSREPFIMRRFRWMAVDTAVVIITVGEIVAGLSTTELGELLQNRAGSFFDTALVYFAARLAVATAAEYVYVLKGMLVIAAPVAILGIYQAATGSNPWGVFVNSGAVFEGNQVITEWVENSRRYGVYRANVNFPYSITFGFFFSLVGAAAAGVWFYLPTYRRKSFALLMALAGLGMMSSMSSGPLLGAAMAGLVIIAWPFRRYWKLFVAMIVVSLAVVDVISNRTWYDVLGWYFTFNSETAAYRVNLIKETFSGGMADHWWLGYGLITPRNIGDIMKNWVHRDISNHYIYEVMRFGLLGLLPWVASVVLALRNLGKAFKSARTIQDKWLIWCIGAGISAVLASMLSACWEGQPYNYFYVVLALAAGAPSMVRLSQPTRRPPYVPQAPVSSEARTPVRQGGPVAPSL